MNIQYTDDQMSLLKVYLQLCAMQKSTVVGHWKGSEIADCQTVLEWAL